MDKASHLQMKKKAVSYYHQNQVPQQLELLLNTMFIDDPNDIYGYLSNFFGRLAKPVTIAKITCHSTFNLKGYENITASISCCINGVNKHVLDLPCFADKSPVKEPVTARTKSASEKTPSKNAKKGKKESSVENISRESSRNKPQQQMLFERVANTLQQHFIPILMDYEVDNQYNIDNLLRNAVQDLLVDYNPVSDTQVPTLVLTDGSNHKQETSKETSNVDLPPSDSQECKTSMPDEMELCLSSLFLSLLVAKTSAKLKELPLYKSLIVSMETKEFVGCSLPLPAMSVISCDPSSPGKLMMFKEICIAPKSTMELKQGIDLIMKFSSSLQQTLFSKFGPSGLLKNASGRYTPPIDKQDQVFEILLETAAAMEVTLKETFDIIIDVGASQLYDEEKSKYDLVLGSSPKASEPMIEMYKDLVERYPIVAIIDGIADKDGDHMMKLMEEMSEKCSVYSSEVKREIALKLASNKMVNGMVIQPEKTSTNLTDLFSYTASLRTDGGCHLMISDEWCSLLTDTSVVDLGVALHASYILVVPTSSFISLSRLLQIYHELHGNNQLVEKSIDVTGSQPPSEDVTPDEGHSDAQGDDVTEQVVNGR